MITSAYVPLSEFLATLNSFLPSEELRMSFFGSKSTEEHLNSLVASLRPDLHVYIEYPYVDRVYRDSYYSYYSSKHTDYPRNCLRVSLFSGSVDYGMFFHIDGQKWLKENFLGFFVLRPTPSSGIIGRSCLSPNAFVDRNIRCCVAPMKASICGLSLEVYGFPYSSQDEETITCAETSLWALVEYFSHKYAHYIPVLPSRIHKILSNTAVERQIPSRGLPITSLSFALKELGFAPRIYATKSFDHTVLMDLIDIYIESGIPLIAAMRNSKITHAFLTIGKYTESVSCKGNRIGERGQSKLFDYPNADKLVVIDDNHSPYECMDRTDNGFHYSKLNATDWNDCKIYAFIVPLYPKVYLEAFEAREYFLAQLESSTLFAGLDYHVAVRIFLASGRTYKDKALKNETMGMPLKIAVVGIEMPKFIWVAEIYRCDEEGCILEGDMNVVGLMIVDATETILTPLSVILGTWGNNLRVRVKDTVKQFAIPLQPFRAFDNLTEYFQADEPHTTDEPERPAH